MDLSFQPFLLFLPCFSPSTRWLTHLLPLSLSLPLPRSQSLLIPLGFWSVGPNRTVHTFHKCQSHTKLTPRLYIDTTASRIGEGEIKREIIYVFNLQALSQLPLIGVMPHISSGAFGYMPIRSQQDFPSLPKSLFPLLSPDTLSAQVVVSGYIQVSIQIFVLFNFLP